MDDKIREILTKCGLLPGEPGFHENATIKGHLKLVLTGPDGKVKDVREIPNTITVAHDELVASSMVLGEAENALVDWTGIGTGLNGKTSASTALVTQNARVQNDSNTQGAAAADNDVVHVATFAAGTGTGALLEAGLFTDTGAGATMQAFDDFAVINKGAGDSLVTTWTITYGAS